MRRKEEKEVLLLKQKEGCDKCNRSRGIYSRLNERILKTAQRGQVGGCFPEALPQNHRTSAHGVAYMYVVQWVMDPLEITAAYKVAAPTAYPHGRKACMNIVSQIGSSPGVHREEKNTHQREYTKKQRHDGGSESRHSRPFHSRRGRGTYYSEFRGL